jgi:hypothetical protein
VALRVSVEAMVVALVALVVPVVVLDDVTNRAVSVWPWHRSKLVPRLIWLANQNVATVPKGRGVQLPRTFLRF